MSGDSSINLNQPSASNDNNGNGEGNQDSIARSSSNDNNDNGEGNQGVPLPVPPPAPPLSYRLIIIPNGREIVSVLSALATQFGQPIYIIHGTGYVSQAEFIPLDFPDPPSVDMHQNDPAQIDYLGGWFHPRLLGFPPIRLTNRAVVPRNNEIGVLHVGLRQHITEGVSIATRLIASGNVEVDVLVVCGPGSIIQPYVPGEPEELCILTVD